MGIVREDDIDLLDGSNRINVLHTILVYEELKGQLDFPVERIYATPQAF